jgi:glucose/arabinose dehydrogenase
MAIAPDGRIFVCEQGGRVRLIRDGRLQRKPFLTVPVAAIGEQGLVGITLDPSFADNRRVYIAYTAHAPVRRQVIARFVAGPEVARPGSLQTLLELDANQDSLHVGGGLAFGRDGMLYVGTGDNSDERSAQSVHSTRGKLLRIRPDGRIPSDNPFGDASGRGRAVWAIGLRNAFGIAVDPVSGRMFVTDVGGDRFEEVNSGERGANYGWPILEGPAFEPPLESPVHSYGHDSGCAITRGTFFRPGRSRFPPAWTGRYFFAEYCRGEIRWLDPAAPGQAHLFSKTRVAGPVDLCAGPDGALYYLARGSASPQRGDHSSWGSVVRVLPAAAPARAPTGR